MPETQSKTLLATRVVTESRVCDVVCDFRCLGADPDFQVERVEDLVNAEREALLDIRRTKDGGLTTMERNRVVEGEAEKEALLAVLERCCWGSS
jgi:hypothetical protein